MTTRHPQVRVSGIEVDEKLADVLRYCWALNITTSFSCQGDEDSLGYVQLTSATSGLRFYDLTYKPTRPSYLTEWHPHGNQLIPIVRFSAHGRKRIEKRLRARLTK
jgi:hypothetical protein